MDEKDKQCYMWWLGIKTGRNANAKIRMGENYGKKSECRLPTCRFHRYQGSGIYSAVSLTLHRYMEMGGKLPHVRPTVTHSKVARPHAKSARKDHYVASRTELQWRPDLLPTHPPPPLC